MRSSNLQWGYTDGDCVLDCGVLYFLKYAYTNFPYGAGAVAQWLRHYATNWKVAGSIPNDVTGFFSLT
jgi:hypothetical protein